MRLRNKNTGEIVSLEGEIIYDDKVSLLKYYDSLGEFCEEWEDCEEEPPKAVEPEIGQEYWSIEWDGSVLSATWDNYDVDKECFGIGNVFNSKEEAELAVKKLKAWKRLKDAGFKFNKWEESTHEDSNIAYFTMPEGDVRKYLDLLFGCEE